MTRQNQPHFSSLHRSSFRCVSYKNSSFVTAMAMAAVLHTLSFLGIILPIIIVRLIT